MQIAPNHTHSTFCIAPHRKGRSRKLAVVTGASSGIGEAFAFHFASQGYDLLITGRRHKALYHVASKISSTYGVIVFPIIADLSVKEDVENLIATITRLENIEILINNAGYSLRKRFSEGSIDEQMAMMNVHVNVPLKLVHSVLPNMIVKRTGTIINVSSLAADMPTPENAMYSGTKSFLKNFSESLHLDVEQYGIHVQCLCPGFTHTNFHRNHKSASPINHPIITWMRPEEVVKYSIKNLGKNKVICIPGLHNRFINAMVAATPRKLYYLLARKIAKKIKETAPTGPSIRVTKKAKILPVQYN